MKLYKDGRIMQNVDKDQLDVCIKAGWSRTEPVDEVALEAAKELKDKKEQEELSFLEGQIALEEGQIVLEEGLKALEEGLKALESDREVLEVDRKALEVDRKALESDREVLESDRKAKIKPLKIRK